MRAIVPIRMRSSSVYDLYGCWRVDALDFGLLFSFKFKSSSALLLLCPFRICSILKSCNNGLSLPSNDCNVLEKLLLLLVVDDDDATEPSLPFSMLLATDGELRCSLLVNSTPCNARLVEGELAFDAGSSLFTLILFSSLTVSMMRV